MLSERDEQVLLAAEVQLRKDDDRLVRAFEAFARCGDTRRPLDPREVLDPRDVRELSATYVSRYADPPRSRWATLFYRVCRAVFVAAFVALLAVFFWVFGEGDLVLRLLSVVVMLPVVGLLAMAVMVLDLERSR